jgi:hypothetical protein
VRVKLGEPYRTILGHLRHEIGHYYQNVLIQDDETWARCRDLFGDERASYQEALTRHYAVGAPNRGRTRSSRSTPRCTRGRTSPRRSRTTSTSSEPCRPPPRSASGGCRGIDSARHRRRSAR